MISMDKEYKTREGLEVRIYATDGAGTHPVQGAVENKDGWYLAQWTQSGKYVGECDSCNDLIEVKPRMKFERWVVFEPDGGYALWVDKPNLALQTNLFALKHISFEVEEGEGLPSST
jgi:hypothetical protein